MNKLNNYMCTSEKDQVQLLARSEEDARELFREYHGTPVDEIIEVVNLTEL
jgi:hypothetical protein